MAKPTDDYNPIPTASPSTGMPDDYSSARSSADSFGGQIGQALQSAGSKVESGTKELFNTLLQKQGMLNETMAANADSLLQVKQGDILSQYKSQEGLAAVAAHDQAVKDIQESREQLRATLPNIATQRAFDMMTLRTTGYSVRDIGDHAATQLKQANNNSASAGRDLAINNASSPDVALDPQRFDDQEKTVKFYTQQIVQNQGYIVPGADGKVAYDKNGDPIFPDTPQGQMGKTIYDDQMSKAMGQIWYNRIETIAKDPTKGNPLVANQMFEANRSSIPPEAQAKISAMLFNPVRSYQAKDIGNQVYQQVDQDYKSQFSGARGPQTSDAIFGSIFHQESNSGQNNKTSIDGAHGPGQMLPGTFAQFAHSGESIDNPQDNINVSKRAIAKYTADYHGDSARVAVAYFSGPGNVSPPGSPNPWKVNYQDGNHKTVSSYVSDVTNRLPVSSTDQSSPNYQTKADYLESHYSDIVDRTRQEAESVSGDVGFVDTTVSHMEQRLNDEIRTNKITGQADTNLVLRSLNGAFNGGTPLTSADQLDHSTPEVREAWQRLQITNPKAYESVQRIATANSRGQAVDFGNNFYKYYSQVASGAVTDPLKDLSGRVGPDKISELTNTGYKALTDMITQRHDPSNAAFMNEEMKFFKSIHDDATGQKIYPGMHSPKLEAEFSRQMQILLPIINQGKAQGLTPGQLFKPDSPNYVGNSYSAPKESDVQNEGMNYLLTGHSTTPQVNQVKTKDDVVKLWNAGQFKSKKELMDFLVQHHLAQNAPEVPKPSEVENPNGQ